MFGLLVIDIAIRDSRGENTIYGHFTKPNSAIIATGENQRIGGCGKTR